MTRSMAIANPNPLESIGVLTAGANNSHEGTMQTEHGTLTNQRTTSSRTKQKSSERSSTRSVELPRTGTAATVYLTGDWTHHGHA